LTAGQRETDRQRLSAIAHTGSLMWGPISESTLDALLAAIEGEAAAPNRRVIDLGCGPAELSRRLAERSGARVVAVDVSPFAIEEAGRRLAASAARELVELRLGDVTELEGGGGYDRVICIGPGWKSGSWLHLGRWATRFASRNALLVLGEGAWRRHPSTAELARLGMTSEDYPASEDVEGMMESAGLHVAWTHRSDGREWSAYAETYRTALDRFGREHPDDPIAGAALERAGSGWSEFELLHDLLDFVLVVCRAPRALPQSGA
jgi:SAM-dependent methyltransferase